MFCMPHFFCFKFSTKNEQVSLPKCSCIFFQRFLTGEKKSVNPCCEPSFLGDWVVTVQANIPYYNAPQSLLSVQFPHVYF